MIPSKVTLLIFAAGFGTRMEDLTCEIPKPMLPLRGKPMIDHAIEIAKSAGLETVFANTHYLHDRLAPHLAAANITALHETPTILDTGAGLKAASDRLTSPTLTLNPDCDWYGPNPLTHLIESWDDNLQSLLLVVPQSRAINREAPGDFTLTDTRLTRGGDMVYTGAQLIRTERLKAISDPVFSLNRYWDDLERSNDLHGVVYPGRWVDIGTKQALIRANETNDV